MEYTSLLHYFIVWTRTQAKNSHDLFFLFVCFYCVCIFSIAFLIRLNLTLVFLLGKFHRMHFKHVWGAKRASDEVWDKKKERKRVRMSDKWNREPKKWKKHTRHKKTTYVRGGRKAVRRKWRKHNKFTCDSSYWSSGFLISFLFLFFCFCFVHAFNDSFYVSHVVHKIRAEHRMSAKISFLHSVCRTKSLNQIVFSSSWSSSSPSSWSCSSRHICPIFLNILSISRLNLICMPSGGILMKNPMQKRWNTQNSLQ